MYVKIWTGVPRIQTNYGATFSSLKKVTGCNLSTTKQYTFHFSSSWLSLICGFASTTLIVPKALGVLLSLSTEIHYFSLYWLRDTNIKQDYKKAVSVPHLDNFQLFSSFLYYSLVYKEKGRGKVLLHWYRCEEKQMKWRKLYNRF